MASVSIYLPLCFVPTPYMEFLSGGSAGLLLLPFARRSSYHQNKPLARSIISDFILH